jgi:8-oxo-dGTP pyrophosphatase MutT (NUDIX family)
MSLAVLADIDWLPMPNRMTVELGGPLPGVPITATNVIVTAGRQILMVDVISRGWSLPGGRIEPGESALECGRRELHEEAGLVRDDLQIIGSWQAELLAPPPATYRYGSRTQLMVAAVRLPAAIQTEPVMTSEVAATRWFDLAEIADHKDAELLLPLIDWWLGETP